MTRLRGALPAILLALVVVTTFATSLRGGFVWDDRPLIVSNALIRDAGGLRQLLTSGFWETGDNHDRFRAFFRPVVSASYAGDYALWGLDPLGFRLTNLLIHALCCLLVYRIAAGEGLARLGCWIGAALFAVHPAHVESVAWISGRTDLLCALFVLLSFAAHRRAEAASGRWLFRSASLVFFAVALFSKEMAATLPLLIAVDRSLGTSGGGSSPTDAIRQRLLRGTAACLPYLCVLGLYLVARHFALGHESDPLYRLTPMAHAATALFVLARYVTLLLVPIGLDAHYPYQPIQTLGAPLALLSAGMLAMLAWGAVRARRASPAVTYWIAWFFIALTPVLVFGTFGDVLMADRFLYIPSVALSLLAARCAAALSRSGTSRRVALMTLSTATILLVAFGVATAARATVWTDDLKLFTRMIETSPDSAMVRCNLGLAFYNKGRFSEAKEEFRTAIGLAPTFAMAHNNLAAAFEREGRLAEALAAYQRALEIAPRQIETRINASSLRVRLGDTERGLQELRAFVENNSRYTAALYAYAEALDRAGRPSEALDWARRAMMIDPAYPNAHYLEGKILAQRGETVQAAAAMRRFLELWPEEGIHTDAARRVIAQAEGS